MTGDELSDIELRVEIAARTGSQVALSALEALALCQAVREAQAATVEVARQRDVAFAQLDAIQVHLTNITDRIATLDQLTRRG